MQPIPNPFSYLLTLAVMASIAVLPQAASAQNSPAPQDPIYQHDPTTGQSRIVTPPPSGASERNTALQNNPSAVVIGPGDEIEITVYGAPDLSEHTRVSSNGNISMPLIGYIRLAGLSSSEAELAIENQLRHGNVVNNPHVSVYVKEYTSSGISVAGEVVRPGVFSAVGPHRLFDILQSAGGLTERAASRATILHRGDENPITVELSTDPVQMASSNVELLPGDTVVIAKAGIVYVLGEVGKPGGYVLNSSGGGVTVLRVVAAAGGPTHIASVGGTKMLRRTPSGLQELRVPLKELLHAKVPDIPVQADDIIYVPSSRLKTAMNAGALLTTMGTAAIYKVPF
jgi:polysaccharide biosynthesis/export protein